jgi:hypothetical protein
MILARGILLSGTQKNALADTPKHAFVCEYLILQCKFWSIEVLVRENITIVMLYRLETIHSQVLLGLIYDENRIDQQDHSRM